MTAVGHVLFCDRKRRGFPVAGGLTGESVHEFVRRKRQTNEIAGTLDASADVE
jgi:hypothetical protein